MEQDEKSFGRVIAETAAATLFWLIAGLSLLAALFPIAFPSASARFYADLDNLPRAYDCAARAAKIDKTVTSRQVAVGYAVSIYEKTGASYAVTDCVPDFLSESEEVFKEIDRKNLAALDGEDEKIYRPSVYSYRDYLAGVLAKVRAQEGNTYLFDGNTFVKGELAIKGETRSLVLVQLTEAAKSTLSDAVFTESYGGADELIEYAKKVVSVPADGVKATLGDVYSALVYARFYEAIETRFSLTDDQKENAKVRFGFENLTPKEYFNRLLTEYVK